MDFKPMIGLETHIELLTKSKIFCSCKNSFFASPNSSCCEICAGFPGAMPNLNKEAVSLAIKAGLSLSCKISNLISFSRKNYVYPDLPKGYQITQGEFPICKDGFFTLRNGKKIEIERIHLEEDAGKITKKDGTFLIDYNRAGVPLIEIVTHPCFSSPDEIKEYLENIALIMKSLNISDCKMHEGSLRCDVNISLCDENNTVSERVEIKNINSVNHIVKAVEYEIKRQQSLLAKNIKTERETRRYNVSEGITEPMRQKENKNDYMYLCEPDIPAIYITEDDINEIKQSLPPMPQVKIDEYIKLGLSYDEAFGIVKYKKISAYFDDILKLSENLHLSKNFIYSSLFKFLSSEDEKENFIAPVPAEKIAEVIFMLDKGEIAHQFFSRIFEKMLSSGKDFYSLFSKEDFSPLSSSQIDELISDALIQNPKAVNDFLSGKEKALLSIVGYIMKKTGGKANAKDILPLLKNAIKKEH